MRKSGFWGYVSGEAEGMAEMVKQRLAKLSR